MPSRLKLLVVMMVAILSAAVFAQTEENYVLGPEDVISVTVQKHPEWSGKYLVTNVGIVEMPIVGMVKLNGMSLGDVSTLVKERLSKELKKPSVSVVLELARPKKVSVLGSVIRPGTVEMKQGWRVTDALGASGGLPPDARISDIKAYIIHANEVARTEVNLVDALAGKPEANLPLKENDVLYIQGLELMPVYVMGAVKAPGVVKLPPTAGPLEAITLAGGVIPSAATTKVKITHVATGAEETYDITPTLNGTGTVVLPKLANGDMITIPESDRQFAVMGYVQSQGVMPMPEGKTIRLSDAVAMAKPTDRARISRVGLIRTIDGKEVRTQYDLGKYINNGDTAQNPVIQPKDVIYIPETDKVDWGILSPLGILARLFW